jgi:hypothetical protein
MDNPQDFVRIEIAAALKRKIPVIPILIKGAKIPSRDKLPPNLKDLSFRSALDVRHDSFHLDVNRLIDTLKRNETLANLSSPSPVPPPIPPEATSETYREKQVKWFERASKLIRLLAEKIQIASTFEDNDADPATRAELWRRVQSAHLALDEVAQESLLYATRTAKDQIKKTAKEVQRVANKTEAFDPPLLPEKKRKSAIEEIYDLSVF